jgi:hypothetical protein
MNKAPEQIINTTYVGGAGAIGIEYHDARAWMDGGPCQVIMYCE